MRWTCIVDQTEYCICKELCVYIICETLNELTVYLGYLPNTYLVYSGIFFICIKNVGHKYHHWKI